jgi:hypothetical protein
MRMRWSGNVTRKRKRNACRIFVGTLEGKRETGRPRCRWDENVS